MNSLTRQLSNRGRTLGRQLGLLLAAPALAIPLLFQSVNVADAAPLLPSTYTKSNTVDLSQTMGVADVSCNPGDFATGGGFDITGGANVAVASEPIMSGSAPNGWRLMTLFSSGSGTVVVVCMTPVTIGGIATTTTVKEMDKPIGAGADDATVSCTGTDFATGGGFEATTGIKNVLRSIPILTGAVPTGWLDRFSVGSAATVKAFVICMAPMSSGGAATSANMTSASKAIGLNSDEISSPCMAGDLATGGGIDYVVANPGPLAGAKFMRKSVPVGSMPPTGWSVRWGVHIGTSGGTITAFAICLHVPDVPPSITVSAKTATDGHNYPGGIWTNQDVIVSFTCTGLGVQPITPVPVSTDGKDQSVTRTCTDSAGETATATFSNIWIDKTPPLTTASLTGTPGTNGWFKAGSPVVLTLSASDNLSGVAATKLTINGAAAQTYSQPITFLDSALWTVTYWSTDNAGNVEASHSISFKVDQTAPTISAAATLPGGASYVAGTWTNQPVAVTFSCTDAPPGVASGVASLTNPVTVATDGANQSATGTCTDLAGNQSSTTFQPIKISTVKPTITVTMKTIDSTGTTVAYQNATWSNHDVTVTFACTTGPSGLKSLLPTTVVVTREDKNPTIPGICTDNAGNSATIDSGEIWIDKTAPTITFAGNPTGNFDISAMIKITCTAIDPIPPSGGLNSGLDPTKTDCATYQINAYVLGVGGTSVCPTGYPQTNLYVVSRKATDNAGNVSFNVTCFTVTSSTTGLAKLTRLLVTNRHVADRLVGELTAAQRAMDRGNLCAAQEHLAAYRRGVQNQIGRTITAAHAATLIQLSKSLGGSPTNCDGEDDDGDHDGGDHGGGNDHGGGEHGGNGGGHDGDRRHGGE